MGLRETDVVDILARGPQGEVVLVICDTGVGYEDAERLPLLQQKLRTCVSYVYDERFPQRHPGKTVRDVRIVVTCSAPPTPEMQCIGAVAAPGEAGTLEVRFEHIPPSVEHAELLRAAEQYARERGRTLPGAAEAGLTAEVDRLLAEGADPNAPDELGLPPFHLAILRRQTVTASQLLEHGVSVDARDGCGFTALHLAAGDGMRDMVEFLLARGADANASEAEGYTPLHAAAEAGRVEVVALLLRRGARVNARRTTGETPLTEAASRGHAAVADLLRRYGGTR
jgi:hypothetical protein